MEECRPIYVAAIKNENATYWPIFCISVPQIRKHANYRIGIRQEGGTGEVLNYIVVLPNPYSEMKY